MSLCDVYRTPLSMRYGSKEMSYNFSESKKFSTWRKLWIFLAEAEQELGLPVTDEQINEMKSNVDKIDVEFVKKEEERIKHDVMAHIHDFSNFCPKAKSIIHLGATSCFVGDNTDQIVIRDAINILLPKLARCIKRLSDFADRHKSLACLGYTHYQPAQPVTVGKRAMLWVRDLLKAFTMIQRAKDDIEFRGCKGTTGTQASFLQIFGGDRNKVRLLDELVTKKAGFKKSSPIVGQTYSRLDDASLMSSLALLGAAAHKFATDVRLLASKQEIEEPFDADQVGSSAMPYKRNPMRCERICALARLLMNIQSNFYQTAANQWLERTLDDSANRRITIPEAFLAADAILVTLQNVSEGLVVYEKVIEKNLNEFLPFMAAENVIVAMVESGGDRQECHEKIRIHSNMAALQVKKEGKRNDLLDRIKQDDYFFPIVSVIDKLLDPQTYIGCAPEQVADFIEERVKPALKDFEDQLEGRAHIFI